jgi:hypothetical protein
VRDDEDERIFRQGQAAAARPVVKARVKRKKVEPFVKLPLWWAKAAANATRTPAALVWIELAYMAWRAKSLSFPLSNGKLEKLGVSRKIKHRVLRDLERKRLIIVERSTRKTPIVTLVVL